jgi:hypothetical protein
VETASRSRSARWDRHGRSRVRSAPPLGQIVVLAGYDATALEEIPPVVDGRATRTDPEPAPAASPADAVAATAEQLEEIRTLIPRFKSASQRLTGGRGGARSPVSPATCSPAAARRS